LKIAILSLFTTILLISKSSFQEDIKNLVNSIQSPRDGIASSSLLAIENPFFTGKEENIPSEVINCSSFNIKTATKEDWIKIPKIDTYTATNIIRYRSKNGLENISELNQIFGIGDKRLKSIKQYIEEFYSCVKTEKIVKQVVFKKTTRIFRPLKLQIIVNSKAKISNMWFKVGDKIRNYRVEKIGSDSVKISNSFSQKILKFSKRKKGKSISINISK